MNARSLLRIAVLVAGYAVCLSLRLILITLKKLTCRRNFPGYDKLLILGFGGVGNHLMLTPAVREIKRARPDLNIHVVSSSRLCAEVLEGNPYIDSISVLDITWLKRLSETLKAGKILRLFRPDAVLAAAGINPITGGVISFLSGARIRIGEDWLGRGFLYTHTIKANQMIFEARQNIELAKQLGALSNDHSLYLEMRLTPDEKADGWRWRSEFGISDNEILVGIHPGSGAEQSWKRWDIENFVEVATKLTRKKEVFVVFFLGPDEDDLEKILKMRKPPSCFIHMEANSIRKTAARIASCNIFVSNDSGLRQIAVALGVKSYGIFGPTSLRKNFTDFGMHEAIFHKDVACRPCHYKTWWLACGNAKACLSEISADTLFDRINCFIPHGHTET
jgi:ADP-heptose:LPS heptosyltransferase